jgi:hypothetical protein
LLLFPNLRNHKNFLYILLFLMPTQQQAVFLLQI